MLMERTQIGMLKDDLFDTTTLDSSWLLYPGDSGRIDLTSRPGFLRILPGGSDMYVLTDAPDEDFLCEVHIDHMPILDADRAGLCIFNSEDMVIKLLSYYQDGLTKAYTRLRFVKKGDFVEGWAREENGVWEFKGSTRYLDGAKIGLFLEKGSTIPIDVDRFLVVKDRIMQVDALPLGARVMLTVGGSLVFDQLEVNQQVSINLDDYVGELIFEGQVIVIDPDTGMATSNTEVEQIYGGDIYWHAYINLEVYHNGVAFSKTVENMLGNLENGVIEARLEAINPDAYDNITSSMAVLLTDPGFFGYDWAFIAEDIGGAPGPWVKSIELGEIPAGTGKHFWLRIAKRPLLHLAPELHRFRLKVVGGAG